MNRLIFLCGFMGCGKTTVGKILAQKLNCEFYDTDEMVARSAGKSISNIFSEHGQPRFRDLESQAILETTRSATGVVALGGGSLLSKENALVICSFGTLVYIRVVMPVIESRLLVSHARPLLQTSSLNVLFAAREPGYLKAHIILDDTGLNPNEMASKIVTVLTNPA